MHFREETFIAFSHSKQVYLCPKVKKYDKYADFSLAQGPILAVNYVNYENGPVVNKL